MTVEDLAALSRRERVRLAIITVLLLVVVFAATLHFLQPGLPHRIVLASGPESGIYHRNALRYKALLGRQGVSVEERMTSGAGDNLELLLDSKVDVAFMQGGVATAAQAHDLEMLASLYYEPLWIFYRGASALTQINEFQGKRLAVGAEGSGTRALVMRLLAMNNLTSENGAAQGNTAILSIGGDDALRALQAGEIDAALYVGGAETPAIQTALRDPAIQVMSLNRADAYVRRFPYLTKLTLPAGTIDLATNIPPREITMIGTKAMLVARDGLHSALIDLLVDAAREIHGEQGYFEAAGEFPATAAVDIPVSPDADAHWRFGPSFLHRYLPFWLATLVERAIILIVPLIVVLVPLLNFLPQAVRWRVRSRIFRWYGQLALLERDVATREGTLPVAQWLQDLDQIEQGAARVRTPSSYASEAYTLREHVALVRREVLAKAASRPGNDLA